MATKKSTSGQKTVSNGGSKKVTKSSTKQRNAAPQSTSEGGAAKNVSKSVARSVPSSKAAGSKSAVVENRAVKVKAAPSKALETKSSKPKADPKLLAKTKKGMGAKLPKPKANEGESVAVEKVSKVNVEAPKAASALVVGDRVPVFEALDQNGAKVSNKDWSGAPYVLYFYPKDDTPGCTTEACGFRDELPSFGDLGVKVVGCSPDSPNAHSRFAAKYGLQFTLLADIEKNLAQLFGVWKLKQNYGREYMGVERSTFLIDKSGKVVRQWRGVRVAGHVSEVLDAVRAL